MTAKTFSSIKVRLAAVGAAISLLAGCGYHLAGTQNNMPPYLKTIAIPVFTNSSGAPGVQGALTSSVRDSFINDGRLKVINGDNADLFLKGAVIQYENRPVAFDQKNVASQYWITLGVSIEAIDQVKNKTYVRQSISVKSDYSASLDVAGTEASRQLALTQAYRDLASRVVSLVIEKF